MIIIIVFALILFPQVVQAKTYHIEKLKILAHYTDKHAEVLGLSSSSKKNQKQIADEVCQMMFQSSKAHRYETVEIIDDAYLHSDEKRQRPIPALSDPSNPKVRRPHLILKLIDCHEEEPEQNASHAPCPKRNLKSEEKVEKLEQNVHPIVNHLLKDDKSFCALAKESEIPCDPEFETLTKSIMLKLRRYGLRDTESVRLGLIIYLSEAKNKKKKIKDKDLAGLFSESEKHPEQIIIPANQVRKEEKDFFKSLQSKSKRQLIGAEDSITAKDKGSSQAVSKIVANDGITYYFKRLPDDKEHHPSLRGRAMGAEVAASKLDQLLGFDLVPKTEIVQLGKKGLVGSAQQAAPSVFQQGSEIENLHAVLASPKFQEELSNLHVLNYIGAIGDRRAANIFIDQKSFKIKSIDNETGFHDVIPKAASNYRQFFSGGILPEKYSDHARNRIAKLTYQQITQSLQEVATPEQIEAVWLRTQIVRADIIRKHTKLLP